MKKWLLSLGSMAAIAAPIVTVVACDDNEQDVRDDAEFVVITNSLLPNPDFVESPDGSGTYKGTSYSKAEMQALKDGGFDTISNGRFVLIGEGAKEDGGISASSIANQIFEDLGFYAKAEAGATSEYKVLVPGGAAAMITIDVPALTGYVALLPQPEPGDVNSTDADDIYQDAISAYNKVAKDVDTFMDTKVYEDAVNAVMTKLVADLEALGFSDYIK